MFCVGLLGLFERSKERGVSSLELLVVFERSVEGGVLLSIEGNEESLPDESFSDFVVECKGDKGGEDYDGCPCEG